MNERIKLLAEQAGFTEWHRMDNPNGDAVIQAFAELIVRDCIIQMSIQMDKFGDDQSNNPAWCKAEEAVMKHFGVEE